MALSNKEIPTDLREYIEINILPQYATFDKAHRLNHAEKVIEESMKLAQYYEVEPAMVYTIAAYHDLGLCEGREFHHLISGKILAADEKLRKWFSEAQLQTMKEAVEDHRASNKQAPRSMYGKIVGGHAGREKRETQQAGKMASQNKPDGDSYRATETYSGYENLPSSALRDECIREGAQTGIQRV